MPVGVSCHQRIGPAQESIEGFGVLHRAVAGKMPADSGQPPPPVVACTNAM
jgi:hypothetical protein